MVLIIILNYIINHQKHDKKNPIIDGNKHKQGQKKELKKNEKKSTKKEAGH
tara:strand:- start:54 stop:206 length:153 start_codon:yes stop_codon:yes gene_type:complete